MKKVLSLMGGLLLCLMALHAQSLPSISSATFVTAAPVGESPKSGVTVKVKVPTLDGIATAHVTVADGGTTLHAQEYDIKRVATPAKDGGYILSLRFFTDADLGPATVRVELADAGQTKGTPFTATQP